VYKDNCSRTVERPSGRRPATIFASFLFKANLFREWYLLYSATAPFRESAFLALIRCALTKVHGLFTQARIRVTWGLLMRLYRGFDAESADTITEALSFVKSMVEKYRVEKKTALDEIHHRALDEQIDKEITRINGVEIFLKETRLSWLDVATHGVILDIIRSALEIYLKSTLEAKAKSGLDVFDAKITEIEAIASSELLKGKRTDLYDKYCRFAVAQSAHSGKAEAFLSYSHNDKVLAGKIASLLAEKGVNVFLAHEDIEISEEWREEIFRHLKRCNALIALLTPSFERSVWSNQEAGYMLGKAGTVIPLIAEETDIKKFGFLEALQGVRLREANPEDCILEILGAMFR